jgi:hypothetical protein
MQAKLEIGAIDDPLEREADYVADRVMRMADRTAITEETSKEGLQRKCHACSEEEQTQEKIAKITRKASATTAVEGTWASPIVQEVLGSPGRPLDKETRAFMEPRLGYDFSSVRIHADTRAAESARAVSALAYTVDRHVVFGAGRYDTQSAAGKRLLAHELTHVVQQQSQGNRLARSPVRQRIDGLDGVSSIDDDLDALAQPIAIRRTPAIPSAAPAVVQRKASFAAGAVHAVNNVAVQALRGAEAGKTVMTLNGNDLLTTAPGTAIAKPTLSTSSASAGGVACQVATVANNVGSFDETVLSGGPWSTVTTKVNAGAVLGLPACTGAGNTTLTANGKPSDADVAAANRKHEDNHAANHGTVFAATISNWDILLTNALNAGTTFNGADQPACEAALFSAMGRNTGEYSHRLSGWLLGRWTRISRNAIRRPTACLEPDIGRNLYHLFDRGARIVR